MGQGPDRGCSLISDGLNRVFGLEPGIMVLLETMAGKGTECGRNFEELATIIDASMTRRTWVSPSTRAMCWTPVMIW